MDENLMEGIRCGRIYSRIGIAILESEQGCLMIKVTLTNFTLVRIDSVVEVPFAVK